MHAATVLLFFFHLPFPSCYSWNLWNLPLQAYSVSYLPCCLSSCSTCYVLAWHHGMAFPTPQSVRPTSPERKGTGSLQDRGSGVAFQLPSDPGGLEILRTSMSALRGWACKARQNVGLGKDRTMSSCHWPGTHPDWWTVVVPVPEHVRKCEQHNRRFLVSSKGRPGLILCRVLW